MRRVQCGCTQRTDGRVAPDGKRGHHERERQRPPTRPGHGPDGRSAHGQHKSGSAWCAGCPECPGPDGRERHGGAGRRQGVGWRQAPRRPHAQERAGGAVRWRRRRAARDACAVWHGQPGRCEHVVFRHHLAVHCRQDHQDRQHRRGDDGTGRRGEVASVRRGGERHDERGLGPGLWRRVRQEGRHHHELPRDRRCHLHIRHHQQQELRREGRGV